MTISPRGRARINISVLLVSAIAWMVLLINPGSTMTLSHCPVTDSGASLFSFQMLLAMNPPSSMIAGWAVMLAAMMSPALMAPVRHVVERSFKRRRARSVMLFVIGYSAMWMAAGVALLGVKLELALLAPRSYFPAPAVGLVAFVWQCSPIKQLCLNRSHNHRELAAFGVGADLDALRFGITHGGWCAGSCWALMLFPLLLSNWHLPAMFAATFLMISERLEPPKRLSWRLRGSGKLMRILVAQARIRLQSPLPVSRPSFSPGLHD